MLTTVPTEPACDQTIALAGGALDVTVNSADLPLDALCRFAARNNARRGFLVVSRVLGRHLPARPSTMRACADALAAKLPAELPGPVVVFGLAETAVCLGHSVHEAYRRRTGRADLLFLHSTRQASEHPPWAAFEEPHSHAAAHHVYTPRTPLDEMLRRARTLVLVDDEITTGVTLANAAQALARRSPRLERVIELCLTDWSGGGDADRLSLLSGRLHWRPSGGAFSVPSDHASARASFGRAPATNFGRFGLTAGLSADSAMVETVRAQARGRSVLVLGVGEFAYPPFLLAEALEGQGLDVELQTASRSPIQLGGPVQSVLTFDDPYGSAATHHVYNPPRRGARLVALCHEPSERGLDPVLLDGLTPLRLQFGTGA